MISLAIGLAFFGLCCLIVGGAVALAIYVALAEPRSPKVLPPAETQTETWCMACMYPVSACVCSHPVEDREEAGQIHQLAAEKSEE